MTKVYEDIFQFIDLPQYFDDQGRELDCNHVVDLGSEDNADVIKNKALLDIIDLSQEEEEELVTHSATTFNPVYVAEQHIPLSRNEIAIAFIKKIIKNQMPTTIIKDPFSIKDKKKLSLLRETYFTDDREGLFDDVCLLINKITIEDDFLNRLIKGNLIFLVKYSNDLFYKKYIEKNQFLNDSNRDCFPKRVRSYLLGLIAIYLLELEILKKVNDQRQNLTPDILASILMGDISKDEIVNNLQQVMVFKDVSKFGPSKLANRYLYAQIIQIVSSNFKNRPSCWHAIFNAGQDTQEGSRAKKEYYHIMKQIDGQFCGRAKPISLRRAIEITIKTVSIVQSYRETHVLKMLTKAGIQYSKDNVFLDPCGGWANRYVGAFLSDSFDQIVINDANDNLKQSYENIRDFLNENYSILKTPLKNRPETVFNFEPFEMIQSIPALTKGKPVTFAMTSPPYFNKELYQGSQSSHVKFKTTIAWELGFYQPMLEKLYDALVPGGFVCLTVADIRLGKQNDYLLVSKTINIMSQLNFIRQELLAYTANNYKKSSLHGETTMLFQKPAPFPKQIQYIKDSGDPSHKKHAIRMTNAPSSYENIDTYPQLGELRNSCDLNTNLDYAELTQESDKAVNLPDIAHIERLVANESGFFAKRNRKDAQLMVKSSSSPTKMICLAPIHYAP